MRILFWTDGFFPRLGGIETQGIHFIAGLQQRGHQCLVLTHQDNLDWPEDEIYCGIQIKRFDFNRIILQQDPRRFRPVQDFLEWVQKEFLPDIIHLNSCVGGSVFMFLLFNSRFRIPSILTIYAPFLCGSEISPLVKMIFSSVSRACCVSKWVLSEMIKYLPSAKDKLRVIYNGLSLPEIAPTPLPFSPPTLLSLGRFSKEKGFETAIEAFSLLKKNQCNARFLIVGDGWERPSLDRLIKERGLSDSVQLIDQIPPDRVPFLISQATLVIVPSYAESFGLVALEAMQMGRPVIASRIGGLQELIDDGKTGLLVPPQDPAALSQAMQSLLKDPARAQWMGAQGRLRSEQNFTLLQHVVEYENLYKELIL